MSVMFVLLNSSALKKVSSANVLRSQCAADGTAGVNQRQVRLIAVFPTEREALHTVGTVDAAAGYGRWVRVRVPVWSRTFTFSTKIPAVIHQIGHDRLLPNPDTKLTKLNSAALVLERTIPTERPPLVGEISTKFCG
jgi:hypothetical protein